jgi:hypothetical protein
MNLPKTTTYTARHSFATVLKRSGSNIAFISESLGHSDLKTTKNYLASFETEERKTKCRIADKILNLREYGKSRFVGSGHGFFFFASTTLAVITVNSNRKIIFFIFYTFKLLLF